MELKVTTELKDIEGKPIPNTIAICRSCGRPQEDKGNHTLRSALVESLLAFFPDDRGLSGEEKLRRYQLAQQIFGNDTVTMKSEDVTLCKKVVAQMYGPLVSGQVWQILDS